MSVYDPWKATLPDGTEVLVSLYWEDQNTIVASAEVAFRDKPHHTWGPPVTLERAP